jgi:hypothetical protein
MNIQEYWYRRDIKITQGILNNLNDEDPMAEINRNFFMNKIKDLRNKIAMLHVA